MGQLPTPLSVGMRSLSTSGLRAICKRIGIDGGPWRCEARVNTNPDPRQVAGIFASRCFAPTRRVSCSAAGEARWGDDGAWPLRTQGEIWRREGEWRSSDVRGRAGSRRGYGVRVTRPATGADVACRQHVGQSQRWEGAERPRQSWQWEKEWGAGDVWGKANDGSAGNAPGKAGGGRGNGVQATRGAGRRQECRRRAGARPLCSHRMMPCATRSCLSCIHIHVRAMIEQQAYDLSLDDAKCNGAGRRQKCRQRTRQSRRREGGWGTSDVRGKADDGEYGTTGNESGKWQGWCMADGMSLDGRIRQDSDGEVALGGGSRAGLGRKNESKIKEGRGECVSTNDILQVVHALCEGLHEGLVDCFKVEAPVVRGRT
ncbi:hypothetical protein EDB85DRAFT_2273081 [Lactarius pseudohatsudake]|nr:hypothetical protein EDB85DRAFT_2273081 [Lactarius pseudohatsudake]